MEANDRDTANIDADAAPRDGLAADLRQIEANRRPGAYPHLGRDSDIAALADRLIALGWHKDIDEERLARALMVVQGAKPLIARRRIVGYRVAAIAKAYREDTDA